MYAIMLICVAAAAHDKVIETKASLSLISQQVKARQQSSKEVQEETELRKAINLAKKEAKPLIIFVGQDRRDIDGANTIRWDEQLAGGPVLGVVIQFPDRTRWRIDGKPDDTTIRHYARLQSIQPASSLLQRSVSLQPVQLQSYRSVCTT